MHMTAVIDRAYIQTFTNIFSVGRFFLSQDVTIFFLLIYLTRRGFIRHSVVLFTKCPQQTAVHALISSGRQRQMAGAIRDHGACAFTARIPLVFLSALASQMINLPP